MNTFEVYLENKETVEVVAECYDLTYRGYDFYKEAEAKNLVATFPKEKVLGIKKREE